MLLKKKCLPSVFINPFLKHFRRLLLTVLCSRSVYLKPATYTVFEDLQIYVLPVHCDLHFLASRLSYSGEKWQPL